MINESSLAIVIRTHQGHKLAVGRIEQTHIYYIECVDCEHTIIEADADAAALNHVCQVMK